jgi:RNA polymerase sigma-70 factor (ECF subfamily)
MKKYHNNVLASILARGRLAASEQTCPPDKCLPVSLGKRETCYATTLTNRIEDEVTELLHQHSPALSRYAATVSWDRTIVQDAIQEVFLRYFIARVDGQQIGNPRAWLFRVLRNYVLDCNRRSNSMRAVDLEEVVQLADFRQNVEAGFQQNETFLHAVSFLSPREQECMQLRIEGFDYSEIAQILKIQPGTVGVLLARGLKKIRGTGLFSREQ